MADDINTPVVPFPTPPLDSPTADPAVIPQVFPAVPPQIPVQVSQQPVQNDPPQEKKPRGKTSMIVGALFLLIVLPVIGYYVSQKTNIMNNLPFAAGSMGTDGFTDKDGNWYYKDSQGQRHVDNSKDKGDDHAGGGRVRVVQISQTITSTPTHTPTTTPTTTLTSTQTPTQTPSPTNPPSEPGNCDASCGVDSDCRSGMICANVDGVKRCRNPQCTGEFSCTCPAVVVLTATPRPIVQQVVVTATPAPVPQTPVSGTPTVLGAATIGGGVLLLLLGLLL